MPDIWLPPTEHDFSTFFTYLGYENSTIVIIWTVLYSFMHSKLMSCVWDLLKLLTLRALYYFRQILCEIFWALLFSYRLFIMVVFDASSLMKRKFIVSNAKTQKKTMNPWKTSIEIYSERHSYHQAQQGSKYLKKDMFTFSEKVNFVFF